MDAGDRVPDVARRQLSGAFGLTLVTIVGLLATAALGSGYRFVRRAGTAGWAGITALDVTMAVTVPLIIPTPAWPVILAIAASMARIAWSAKAAARAAARARTGLSSA